MKAYVFTAHGGPEIESYAEVPRPAPGPGQVLIAVQIAVHAAGVSGFAVGDAVFGNSDGGGFPEYALLPVELQGKAVIEVVQ